MLRREVRDVATALGLAAACAEAAVRLLAPSRDLPEAVPVQITEHFTPEQIERGRDYARGQLRLGLLAAGGRLLALGAATRRGRSSPPPLTAAALSLGLSLISLPASAMARRRAIAVGLATQSWPEWGRDQAKAAGIGLPLAVAGGTGLSWATERWPRRWWLPVSGGMVALGAVVTVLAPVVLDPVFNRFRPLEGGLREDVLELAGRAGVSLRGVMRMDASRRTSAANAYVSGWGPTRRVVLYDTLLDRYSRQEVRAVVAHELAHVQGRDVARGLAFMAIVAPAGTLALQRLARLLSPRAAAPVQLPELALAAGLLGGPLGFFAGRLSRAVERRADAVSLELVDDPEAFVSFERRIAAQNLSDLEPPWWVRQLLATHPSTGERIGMALSYAKTRAGVSRPQ